MRGRGALDQRKRAPVKRAWIALTSCALFGWIAAALLANFGAPPRPAQAAPIAGRPRDAGFAFAAHAGQAPIRLTAPASRTAETMTNLVFLPYLAREIRTCTPIEGESYGTLSVNPPPTDRPAEKHPDLNLALRGYTPTTAFLGLIDVGGATDPNAPHLVGLFVDQRTPSFSAVYRVYDWDWSCNCRGDPLKDPEVTLAGLAVTPGEAIHVPQSGYTIGSGYEVLVLYASATRITLKYTRDDNVVAGYTLHVEKVCVEPRLLALYRQMNEAGRGHLPALRAGQAFGRAVGNEIGVAIRDYGTFLDPRSRKDWWPGR